MPSAPCLSSVSVLFSCLILTVSTSPVFSFASPRLAPCLYLLSPLALCRVLPRVRVRPCSVISLKIPSFWIICSWFGYLCVLRVLSNEAVFVLPAERPGDTFPSSICLPVTLSVFQLLCNISTSNWEDRYVSKGPAAQHKNPFSGYTITIINLPIIHSSLSCLISAFSVSDIFINNGINTCKCRQVKNKYLR